MKIFNWVHRKFHHKDGLGGDHVKKKAEKVTTELTETQVLLNQQDATLVVDDALDGWRYGLILTIGTFGFDPLTTDFNHEENKSTLVVEKEEHDDDLLEDDHEKDMKEECDEEEEEVNPLIFAALEEGGSFHEGIHGNITPLSLSRPCHDQVGFGSNDLEKTKKERTTLADLLRADAADPVKTKKDRGGKQLNIKQEYSNKKGDDSELKQLDDDANVKKKGGLLFAKKLIPRVGDDTRPIKKLHQLMGRMLKRKIHPDLEGKLQKRDSTTHQINPTIPGLLAVECGTTESVCLLHTRDSIV